MANQQHEKSSTHKFGHDHALILPRVVSLQYQQTRVSTPNIAHIIRCNSACFNFFHNIRTTIFINSLTKRFLWKSTKMELFYYFVFGSLAIIVAALESSKNNNDRVNTSSAFNSLKNNYVLVYSLMMGNSFHSFLFFFLFSFIQISISFLS